MKLQVGASWTKVEGTQRELEWLEAYVGCDTVEYVRHSGRVKRVEGRFSAYVRETAELPTGLLPLVEEAAPSAGVTIEYDREFRVADIHRAISELSHPPPRLEDLDLGWLRDDQLEAVAALASAGRGILKAPTGAGKTETFVGLTKVLPRRWLFACHRADLPLQAAHRYELRTGIKENGNDPLDRYARTHGTVSFATFQSLRQLLLTHPRGLEWVEALCVDEVHAAAAETYYSTIMACRNAFNRFGLSATPLDRGERDTLMTVGAIGPIVHTVDPKRLFALGCIAYPSIQMLRCDQKGKYAWKWRKVYDNLVVNSKLRNEVVVDMVRMAAKPCLVFVDEAKHGKVLRDAVEAAGFRCDFAHGSHSVDLRRKKLDDLASGLGAEVLVCTVIFQEGVDVPAVGSVVNAAGESSVVATIQRIGRGMRVAPGKHTFEVWDVMDGGQRWLEKHAWARLTAYRDAGYPVVLPGGEPARRAPELPTIEDLGGSGDLS